LSEPLSGSKSSLISISYIGYLGVSPIELSTDAQLTRDNEEKTKNQVAQLFANFS